MTKKDQGTKMEMTKKDLVFAKIRLRACARNYVEAADMADRDSDDIDEKHPAVKDLYKAAEIYALTLWGL